MVMIGIDRAQIQSRRQSSDAGVDAAGHEARTINGGTDMAQAHDVTQFVHKHRHEIDLAGSRTAIQRRELPRVRTFCKLFVHQRRLIDEPSIPGGIGIECDRGAVCEGQVPIGQIGYRNGGLVEQRQLIGGQAHEARPK